MKISYHKLWILCSENNLSKTDLRVKISLSTATLAKLSSDKLVALEILCKICNYFKCDIGDIMEIKYESVNDREWSPGINIIRTMLDHAYIDKTELRDFVNTLED